jgi:hypothetical protein
LGREKLEIFLFPIQKSCRKGLFLLIQGHFWFASFWWIGPFIANWRKRKGRLKRANSRFSGFFVLLSLGITMLIGLAIILSQFVLGW